MAGAPHENGSMDPGQDLEQKHRPAKKKTSLGMLSSSTASGQQQQQTLPPAGPHPPWAQTCGYPAAALARWVGEGRLQGGGAVADG